MGNLARLRKTRTRVVKVQRRIWLVQVAFWPAVTLGGIAVALKLAGLARRRYKAAAAGSDISVASSPDQPLYSQAAADGR